MKSSSPLPGYSLVYKFYAPFSFQLIKKCVLTWQLIRYLYDLSQWNCTNPDFSFVSINVLRPMLETPEILKPEVELKKARIRTDSLLRETATNYIRLIGDADRKARIILVVNTIFLTICITLLNYSVRLDSYVWISVLILLLANLFTLFYSIKSVKPEFRREKTELCRENILHYNKCQELTLQEYNTTIRETMEDEEKKMDSMIKDLYYYGNLLHIKYRLLGIAYRLFSWGIFLAVFSYLLILLLNNIYPGL